MGSELQTAPPVALPAPTLSLRGSPSWGDRQSMAVTDVREAAKLSRLIVALGWLDIRLRYRGSLLGPFWLTLSTAVMVGALGFLYSTLFHQTLHDYLPFLTLSLVLWNASAAVVGEACTVFTVAEATIRSMRLPFFVQPGRMVVRQFLILLHNAVVVVAVFAIFRIFPGKVSVFAIPGAMLWLLDWLASGVLLGSLCARFRDIPQIVNSVMQIAFFVTPVVWRPEQMVKGQRFLPLNPFYDLLEVVRQPLLGVMPSMTIWEFAVGYTVLLCALAWMAFSWARGRLAFWL